MSYAISVIISTYNDQEFVTKKCAEILTQTAFEKAEFIFIETASPQQERLALQPFCDRHANCRLITTETRLSLYQAWNLGWRAAHAPLVCYSNMDDLMHPYLLEKVVEKMVQRPWDACTVLIVKTTEEQTQFSWSADTLRRLPLSKRPGPFTAWRKDLSERIGYFDERFIIAGDKDFWARMVANRLRIALIPKVLYRYCKSSKQLSKQKDNAAQKTREKALADRKPYRHRWSCKMRWLIFFIRFLFRWFPGYFLVPCQKYRSNLP